MDASAARACVSVDYHHMYDCGSLNENASHFFNHIFYGDMGGLIYVDAADIHTCADNYHLKEGTPKYEECLQAVS